MPNGSHVFLIEHSVPNPKSPGDCDTHIQAVLLSAEGARSSRAVERVAMCPPFQWDDVMFVGLFDEAPK